MMLFLRTAAVSYTFFAILGFAGTAYAAEDGAITPQAQAQALVHELDSMGVEIPVSERVSGDCASRAARSTICAPSRMIGSRRAHDVRARATNSVAAQRGSRRMRSSAKKTPRPMNTG